MMLGGLLASLGMVASSFSGSLTQLFLSAGLITGNYQYLESAGYAGPLTD